MGQPKEGIADRRTRRRRRRSHSPHQPPTPLSTPPRWKRTYCDGVLVPPSRGWVHGFCAGCHLARAATVPLLPIVAPALHLFLVFQYAVSFALHKIRMEPAAEKIVARLDNYAIAGHIALLSLPAVPAGSQLQWGLLLGLILACAIGLSLHLPRGIEAWSYKIMLGCLFAAGTCCWASSGRLYSSPAPQTAVLYMVSFSLFAVSKFREDAGTAGAGLVDAVVYDCFHTFKVTASLSVLNIHGVL